MNYIVRLFCVNICDGKPILFLPQEVLGYHRDRVVGWILSLNAEFRFSPETLGLAISLIDHFLNLVKVSKINLDIFTISHLITQPFQHVIACILQF